MPASWSQGIAGRAVFPIDPLGESHSSPLPASGGCQRSLTCACITWGSLETQLIPWFKTMETTPPPPLPGMKEPLPSGSGWNIQIPRPHPQRLWVGGFELGAGNPNFPEPKKMPMQAGSGSPWEGACRGLVWQEGRYMRMSTGRKNRIQSGQQIDPEISAPVLPASAALPKSQNPLAWTLSPDIFGLKRTEMEPLLL